jgi:hypothetical protein
VCAQGDRAAGTISRDFDRRKSRKSPDADYGPAEFAACRDTIKYPILSANTLDTAGKPLFQYDGKTL